MNTDLETPSFVLASGLELKMKSQRSTMPNAIGVHPRASVVFDQRIPSVSPGSLISGAENGDITDLIPASS